MESLNPYVQYAVAGQSPPMSTATKFFIAAGVLGGVGILWKLLSSKEPKMSPFMAGDETWGTAYGKATLEGFKPAPGAPVPTPADVAAASAPHGAGISVGK